MLLTLIVLPLMGMLLVYGIGGTSRTVLGKQVTLAVMMANFILSVYVWVMFDSSSYQLQFVYELTSGRFGHLHLGVDGLSLYYVLLTTFLSPLCVLASWSNVTYGLRDYLLCLLLIESMLIAVFTVMDLLLFYVAFEASLVPLFYLVGTWGAGMTRVRAALMLFLYTLAGSLFMLLSIIRVYTTVGTLDLVQLSMSDLALESQLYLWVGFSIAMVIKTPLIPFHTWLPLAHSSAPLAGSMLLAGLVLKMATYGFYRVVLPILPDATYYFTPALQLLAMVSLVYASLATIRQTDVKNLVAYSSIGHMAVVILGLFSNSIIGIEGALALSIAHGFVSPGMFMLVGGVLYDRTHTRTIQYYHGLALYLPVFSLLLFLFTSANMGVPLSLNWLGELMSLAGAFATSPLVAMVGASGIVLSAGYSIWLYGRMVGGAYSPHLGFLPDVTRREFMVLLPLILMTLLTGVYPAFLLNDLHMAASQLVYS